MKKTTKKVDEAAFKSFNDLDLSKIPGSVTQILTANFDRFNACRTYEDVVALCHELFDGAGLNTDWTRKFFFRLDQIKAENPNPRRAYEKAMLFMNNARMKGMGLGMGRGSRRFGESKDDSKTNESKSTKKQYTKKQITEAIAYWQKQLKKIDESTSQEIPKELFKECIAADWPSIDSMDIDAMILSTREDYNQFIDAATVPQKLRAKIDSMWSLGYDYIIYYYTDEDDGALEEAMDKMMKENPKYGLLEYAKDYVAHPLETVYVIGFKWRRA